MIWSREIIFPDIGTFAIAFLLRTIALALRLIWKSLFFGIDDIDFFGRWKSLK